MTDEKAIEELKQGNISALEYLYEEYSTQALRTAYLITSDRYMAEDILQDAFIQCYRYIGSLKDNSSFKPWFYRILTRLAFREIKKTKKLLPVENIFENDTAVSDEYFQGFENSELCKYIDRLKPKLKTTVILFYYDEMSIKEIAGIMSCREGTVKSRLNTARVQLKGLIGSREALE